MSDSRPPGDSLPPEELSGPSPEPEEHESVFTVLGGHTAVTRINLRDVQEDRDTPVLRPPRMESVETVPGQIGPYQVIGEIARGGVGAILKARDTELGRDIALKVLLDEHMENPDLRRRFVEEAQIGGQLQHPGIVPIHKVGLLAGDKPYFTMKLVKGRTLAALLEERSDPKAGRHRFLGVFEQVCQTIAYAHARKVIHRDLKPANVMVGAFGEVQVMDWGLAKVLTDQSESYLASEKARTQFSRISIIETIRSGSVGSDSLVGSVLGTPAYMAPEQARGELEDVDERSDVFGLGAILCEILTGVAPYAAPKTEDIYRQAKKGYLDDAFARLDASGAEAPLVALAKRCLAFEPRERPRDATAVAAEIQDYLSSMEERRRRSGLEAAEARARAAQVRRLRRLTLGVAATCVLALLAGGGGYLWLAGERAKERRAAVAAVNDALNEVRETRSRAAGSLEVTAWELASNGAKRAEARARDGGVEDLLAEATDLRRTLEGEVEQVREQVALREKNRRAVEGLEAIGASTEDTPHRFGLAYKQVFLDFGIDVEALDEEEAARRIRESGIAEELARGLGGWAAWSQGFHGKGCAEWQRFLRIARAADPDPWRDRLRKAVEDGDRAELRRVATELDPREVSPKTLAFLAGSLQRVGEPTGGIYRKARRLYPDDPSIHRAHWHLRSVVTDLALRPESARALRKVSGRWWGKGRNDLHLAYAREAIRKDPQMPSGHNMLGIALHNRRDVEGARRAYERVIELDPYASYPYNNIAGTYDTASDYERMIELYREALRLGPNSDAAWKGLALTLDWGAGDPTGSIAARRELIRLQSRRWNLTPADQHAQIGRTFLIQLRDPERAASEFREAIRLRPGWGLPRASLGHALWRQGRHAEALGSLGAAFELAVGDLPARNGACERILETLTEQGPSLMPDPDLAAAFESFFSTASRARAAAADPHPLTRKILHTALSLLAEAGDPGRALELSGQELEENGRGDAESLGLVARTLLAAGRGREAIRTLEEATELAGATSSLQAQLDVYRKSHLPDLVTYGSIDQALEQVVLASEGAQWRFFRGRREPSPGLEWTEVDFDDSQWDEGPSGFGYGDADDATVLSDMPNTYTSVFIRRRIHVPDPAVFRRVLLHVRVDDGYVAYLNGREVGRYKAGEEGQRMRYDAVAPEVGFAPDPEDSPPVELRFVRGENVLAIQGLNNTRGSTDLSLIPVVRAEFGSDPEKESQRFAEFREAARGDDAAARRTYLEARVLQRAGKLREAAARFEEVVAADPKQPEPWLHLAECLVAAGKAAEVEARLVAAFRAGLPLRAAVLDFWFLLAVVDGEKGAAEILDALGRATAPSDAGPGGDLLWALRELAEKGALRIHCGGDDHLGADGTFWGRDRFFVRGQVVATTNEIRVTEDDSLYQKARAFTRPDLGQVGDRVYRIPLPRGSYRVTLYFAETVAANRDPGRRVFDVVLEGEQVLAAYDAVAAAGWATADARVFHLRVDDGYLEVGFQAVTATGDERDAGDPLIAAIEIEKAE